jgi:hypothetical protein
MSESVECHSEYEYAERPLALTWNGQRLEISDILEQWHNPGEKCFRVRTTEGQMFELCYGEFTDEWRICQA